MSAVMHDAKGYDYGEPVGPLLLWARPDSRIVPQEVRDRIAHAEKDKRRWRRFLRRGVVVRGVRYQVVSG